MHRATWPPSRTSRPAATAPLFTVVSGALSQVRRAKSEQKLSMRAEISEATVSGPAAERDYLAAAETELRAAGRHCRMHLVPAPPPRTCAW